MAIVANLVLPPVVLTFSSGIRANLVLPPVAISSTCIPTGVEVDIELPGVELYSYVDCTSFSFSTILPAVTLTASVYPSGVSANLILGAIQLYSRIAREYSISLNKTLPPVRLEVSISPDTSISVNSILPPVELEALISPNKLYLILNPTNTALTEYSLSPESIAVKDDTVYISDGTKIYTLSGDTDDTTDISSIIQLGLSDAGTNLLKRVTDTLIKMRSDGQLKVVLIDDENVGTNERTLLSTDDTIKTIRAKIPKGNKCSYYSLRITNVDGSDFEIAKLIILGNILSRRFHA